MNHRPLVYGDLIQAKDQIQKSVLRDEWVDVSDIYFGDPVSQYAAKFRRPIPDSEYPAGLEEIEYQLITSSLFKTEQRTAIRAALLAAYKLGKESK